MLTKEELSSESVHAKNSKYVRWNGSSHSDERLHEDIRVDVSVALSRRRMRSVLRDVCCYHADVSFRVVVRPGPLVETVEHFGEPHHKAVVPGAEFWSQFFQFFFLLRN